jgi:hypothetical protein
MSLARAVTITSTRPHGTPTREVSLVLIPTPTSSQGLPVRARRKTSSGSPPAVPSSRTSSSSSSVSRDTASQLREPPLRTSHLPFFALVTRATAALTLDLCKRWMQPSSPRVFLSSSRAQPPVSMAVQSQLAIAIGSCRQNFLTTPSQRLSSTRLLWDY